MNGGVTFAPGKVGQAFDLDGSTGSVSIPASSSLNAGVHGTGLTIECWIKPNDILSTHPLVEFNNGSAWGVHFWIYGFPQSRLLNVIATGAPNHFVYAPADILTTNDFQHVAGTYDTNSGIGTVYYNGQAVATTFLGYFTPQTSYNLYLGQRPCCGITYYNGLQDEVGIYNRALSATEVAAIYNEGSAGFGFAPTNWLSQYWGSGWATNLNAAATADDVGDGVPNYIKYIQGRNPTNTTVVDTNLVIQLNVYTPLK